MIMTDMMSLKLRSPGDGFNKEYTLSIWSFCYWFNSINGLHYSDINLLWISPVKPRMNRTPTKLILISRMIYPMFKVTLSFVLKTISFCMNEVRIPTVLMVISKKNVSKAPYSYSIDSISVTQNYLFTSSSELMNRAVFLPKFSPKNCLMTSKLWLRF